MSFRISITPSRKAGSRFVAAARREIQKALAEEEQQGGITQSDIARAIGVNRSVISREVRGHADISVGRIAEIAWALGRRPKLVLEKPETSATNRDTSPPVMSFRTQVKSTQGTAEPHRDATKVTSAAGHLEPQT